MLYMDIRAGTICFCLDMIFGSWVDLNCDSDLICDSILPNKERLMTTSVMLIISNQGFRVCGASFQKESLALLNLHSSNSFLIPYCFQYYVSWPCGCAIIVTQNILNILVKLNIIPWLQLKVIWFWTNLEDDASKIDLAHSRVSHHSSLRLCPLSRLWVQSWQKPGTTRRKRRTTCCTPRTSRQEETSTKPCGRSARATPSSASMSSSPCEPGRRDIMMKRDLVSSPCQRLSFFLKSKTCCHPLELLLRL